MKKRKIMLSMLVAAIVSTTVLSPTCFAFAEEVNELETGEEIQEDTTDDSKNDAAEVEDDDSSSDDKVVVEEDDKPYLSLGADLNSDQKAKVLSILGISESQLSNYDVSYVTNDEEHKYLDKYISSDKIGTRSLSSVVVMEGDSGSGIQVTTHNISYCTVGMYKNALVTAGVEDAEVIVAAPSNISGTAALVGVIKAYEVMTGDEVDEDNVDAALNELVITGDIAESSDADNETIEGVVAYVKEAVASGALEDEESIRNAIDEACEKYNVELTDDEEQQIVDLMLKISKLDLDPNKLVEQAQSIYDKVKDVMGSDALGDLAEKFNSSSEGIGGFFTRIINSIKEFFAGLFS